MFSMANLTARATVRRPKVGNTGTMPDYIIMYADEPCRIVCETTSSTSSGFGRMATGRWALVFRKGVVVKVNDRITVSKYDVDQRGYKQSGIYEIDSALVLDTHTEATGVERG